MFDIEAKEAGKVEKLDLIWPGWDKGTLPKHVRDSEVSPCCDEVLLFLRE
jgi:hypothetical protein